MVVWVPIEAGIDLHAELLAEHGGAAGLRDRGALESALARPRQLHSYDPEVDLYALTAALISRSQNRVSFSRSVSSRLAASSRCACGITQKHLFVDGNKARGLRGAGRVSLAQRPVSRPNRRRNRSSSNSPPAG